jgi:xanthine phosphoribosyltransferase
MFIFSNRYGGRNKALHLLEERIRKDGRVKEGNVLKVDGFLNHQMDVELFAAMASEFKRLYEGCGVNKILTIEASGIGIACIAAQEFKCPVIFAKKTKTKNIAGDVYTAKVESYTTGTFYDIIVSKEYLSPKDRVLIIDDFLANGAALDGLLQIAELAGAAVVGAGVAIEKAFQPGGDRIRARGIRVEALARIKSMSESGGIEFI